MWHFDSTPLEISLIIFKLKSPALSNCWEVGKCPTLRRVCESAKKRRIVRATMRARHLGCRTKNEVSLLIFLSFFLTTHLTRTNQHRALDLNFQITIKGTLSLVRSLSLPLSLCLQQRKLDNSSGMKIKFTVQNHLSVLRFVVLLFINGPNND